MDEVKRYDLQQLPNYEAIQHPEIKESEKETEKILEEPGYWISNNDLKLLLGGDESFTPEDEEINKIDKEDYDQILSEDKLNKDKYEIKIILTDPRKPIVKVVERNYGEKPEKGVATFVDTDLDERLINVEADNVLDELKLPLPSKLINRKLEDIQLFQKNADIHLNYYKDLLPPTRAILYTEKGVNKA